MDIYVIHQAHTHTQAQTRLENLYFSISNLKLRRCVFLQNEMTNLGNRINRDGIKLVEGNVRAIQEALINLFV